MNKDTIYIDVEDDITAIIGKVKGAKNKIVALVPPKRIGVLQSAVNLRLLARAAKQTNKHLVLISGNSALTALAAAAGIPSARTLQSKPELAPLPEEDDTSNEDVIDGADLPVGDLARTGDSESAEIQPQAAPAIDSAIRANNAEEAGEAPVAQPRSKQGRGIKVPNFDTFRKRMVLGIVGLVAVVGFLVWAIILAPKANIVITARTIESSANPSVVLATSATTDFSAGTLKAVRQEIQKEASLTFDATGEKEVGEKAKGAIVFQSCESPSPITIAAGTGVSAGGHTYITKEAVVIPASGIGGWPPSCSPSSSSPVAVEAQDIGEEYDMSTGTLCVAGHNCSGATYLRATVTTAIDGGSKKKIKVVTAEDVEKATNQFTNQDVSAVKKDLAGKFGDGVIVIDASFATNKDAVKPSPAVDAEATDGKAKLTGMASYTMIGVAESEAGRFLDGYFAQQIKNNTDQRVYDNGAEKTTFIDVKAVDNGFTAKMTATAKFGPKIDDAAVKSQAKGKRYGEVQSAIEGISGVESVDVKFSPFWVRTVPNKEERITVEFNLDESK
jgi:hypothetical protein